MDQQTDALRKAERRVDTRRVVDVVHRWLGFICGSLLAIAGVTGALLAFYMEIDGAVNPAFRGADPHARPSSYEAIYQRLAQLPVEAKGHWKIEIPQGGGPVTSRFTVDDNPDGINRTRMITLDAVSLKPLRDKRWRETFFTFVYDIHMNLLLGPAGKVIMGLACVLMLFMLGTGVANWALPKGGWASKFRFKRHASVPRRTYDIHKLGGLYSLLLLMLCVATAAMINLPDQVKPILNFFSPLKPPVVVASTVTPSAVRIPVDRAVDIGLKRFPGSQVVWIRVPNAPDDVYDLQMRQAGDPMTRFPRTHLFLDQYTGAELALSDPHTDRAGDTVLNWIVPLHDGKAFGLIGRVWVMLLGLLAPVLFVTGLMRWSQKRTARRQAASRRMEGHQSPLPKPPRSTAPL